MNRKTVFTFVDWLTIIGVFGFVFVLVTVIFPLLAPRTPGRLQVLCQSNLKRIYQAMDLYAQANKGHFPVAGNAVAGPAIGFAEGDRATGKGATMDNNVTASLWLLVQQELVDSKRFICPATEDKADELTDGQGRRAKLDLTHDFSRRPNLSYSMLNMYHGAYAKRWTEQEAAGWVLLADDNNNSAADRHTMSYAPNFDKQQVRRLENSLNHKGDGQTMLLGDGHAFYANAPFKGIDKDNIYAMVKDGKNTAPTLGTADGDAATNQDVANRDNVLLPLTGNGGGAGTLDPND